MYLLTNICNIFLIHFSHYCRPLKKIRTIYRPFSEEKNKEKNIADSSASSNNNRHKHNSCTIDNSIKHIIIIKQFTLQPNIVRLFQPLTLY